MRKHKPLSLALAAVLALLPVLALASGLTVDEYGFSLDFPSSLDVFTRDMREDDPVLGLYGKDAAQTAAELAKAGLFARAYDIGGAFEVGLALSRDSGPDYAGLDEAGLMELASAHGMENAEKLSLRQAGAVLLTRASGNTALCLARTAGVKMELRLTANSGVTARMLDTLRDLARRAEFTPEQ